MVSPSRSEASRARADAERWSRRAPPRSADRRAVAGDRASRAPADPAGSSGEFPSPVLEDAVAAMGMRTPSGGCAALQEE